MADPQGIERPRASRGKQGIRVLWLVAYLLVVVTPRLSAEITVVSRLSDARAFAQTLNGVDAPPPQVEGGILPTNFINFAVVTGGAGTANADCTSISSIVIPVSIGNLRVAGNGTAAASGTSEGSFGAASANLMVLRFDVTDRTYSYSLTGELSANQLLGVSTSEARAKLAGASSTIFEVVSTPPENTVTLSETGTLSPGTYTFSVDLSAIAQGISATTGASTSGANFNLELVPGPTPVATPRTRAINLSTRLRVSAPDQVGIGGFIITGASPKRMLLRAIGPSLTQLGIPDAMSDPVMELFGLTDTIINDNWKTRPDGSSQQAEIEATGIAPTNDFESAIVATLAPGAYTAKVSGFNSSSGLVLVEVYDLDQVAQSNLANISTRAFVGTGANVVIGGFILGGSNNNTNVVLRGIGPSLIDSGVPDALADSTLELRNSNGALVIGNDNWQDDPSQAATISGAGLAPANALESGIVATLAPGSYTALLAGLNNGTGVGLVEIYHVGP